MKQSLGKVLLLILLTALNLWGTTYQWRLLEAPKSLYVNQSGVVRYELTFSTNAADYTIDFKPVGNERFKVSTLTQRDRIVEGKRVQTFDVLITPVKAGSIEVSLEALVRHTTFASIENASIGRDNVKKYDFDDEKVPLPKVRIHAKENLAALSGEIELEVKIDKRSVIAHEPVHVSLFLRGKGNLDQYVPYELNISGVNIFIEEPTRDISPDTAGFSGEIRQEFALVSDKSYVIPKITMDVFDTQSQTIKRLQSNAVAIDVASGFERSNLLDPPQLSDWSNIARYTLYGALILIGVILGEAVRRMWKLRPRRKAKQFYDEAKTSKELVMLLALTGDKRYDEVIDMLERGEIGLSEAKKKLDKLSTDKKVR